MDGLSVEFDTEAFTNKLAAMPDTFIDALGNTMSTQAIGLQSYIVANKLSGNPLNRRTGHLSDSIAVGDLISTDTGVSITVGSNIAYAPVHEFGETVTKKSKLGKTFTQKYPKRDFMQPSYDALKPTIINAINSTLKDVLK